MIKHVTEWLSPYHDGELHGARLLQVEQHLSECTECRNELEGIKRLSALLHEAPAAVNFLPADRFVSNLNLSLPRQAERPRSGGVLEIGWWLIPVSLLGAWLFLQVTVSLGSVATIASDTGLLGGSFSWLQGHSVQAGWFIDSLGLLGNQIGLSGQSILPVLNEANGFVTQSTRLFLWEALLAFSYLGWLLSLWLRHSEPSAQNSGSLSHY